MKKAKILIGAFALALAAATIFACSKEKAENKNHAEETILKEDDMSAYLEQFKKKMQSAEKGGETLSMEEARWHLEAVLNYTYGDAGHQTTDIQCDTFYYRLQANGEEVTLSQLNNAFNALSHDVDVAYGNCDLPEKSVLAIQTLFEEGNGSDDVVVRSILNTGGYRPLNMWFDSTDYWGEEYYDYGDGYISASGKCGPYFGECPNSGAPLELTKKLNLRRPDYGCAHGGGYFTDCECILVCIYSNSLYSLNIDEEFLYDENSPTQYKLYYRNGNSTSACISPDDMNYYLSKGPELIEHYQPEEKVNISAYYQSNEILCAKENNCYHELIILYGAFHCDPNGGVMDD